MCYIDLQHYLHCKHTNATFRSCWNPNLNRFSLEGNGDHTLFRADIHSFDRLCGYCYRDAIERATKRTGKIIAEPWIEAREDRQFVVHLECGSSEEIVGENQKVAREGVLGLNERHGGKVVACMFEGGIDREAALREPRGAFRVRPTHVFNRGHKAEKEFVSAKDASTLDFINDDCNYTTDTMEILMYFSACCHFNGLWCETLREWESGDFVARCGCTGFDEKLAKVQYAESFGQCLLCRRVRREGDRDLLVEMVREISDERELALWPLGQRRPYREVR